MAPTSATANPSGVAADLPASNVAGEMVRILHVTPAEPDLQTLRSAQALARSAGVEFAVETRTIGRRGTWRNIAGAALGLRRCAEFDIVHAWGTSALLGAAMGSRAPIFFSPIEGEPPPVRWLRAVGAQRPLHTVCASATTARALASRGVPPEHVHIIRPGVDFSHIRGRRDPSLRRSLGFKDHDRVLLAVGQSTRAAAHETAAWATALLHEIDPRWNLLTWGSGPDRPRMLHHVRALHKPSLHRDARQVLGESTEFEPLLPTADMLLITARGHVPSLPIAMGMAAALPIVATAIPTVAELLEDRHTAILVPPDQPRLMAQRVLELSEDAGLQWRLADTARTEAYEYFSLTRFLEQYRAIYRQLAAGDTVHVPQPPPGPAQRFHARA